MSRDDIKIEAVSEKDRPWIVEFLTRNFYKDEPITDYLKVCQNPFSLDELKKFSTKNLHQNLSFVAKDSTGNLLGVCINSVHTPDDEDEEITDPIFGKITKFLCYGYEEAGVFEKFPDIEKFLYIDILSVDKSVGGKGIGTLLVQHARDLAREKGIKMIRVDCTSYFSARASEKLGMECVYELKYADYKEDGVQVFNPEPPHTGLKVYVQRILSTKL